MANKNLNKAKEAKKDEFYTQLEDINNELRHYREHFRGKTVLCNCDDPRVSNFFKYFAYNFEFLGLKKLIATCYKSQDVNLFSDGTSEQAVYLVYEGDKNGNNIPDEDEIEVLPLKGDGDFRSPECIEFLKEADIVVTNPPFSLFREYIAQLIEYDKKFLIIGHQNAIKYKEIFPLIKENKLWLGYGFKGGAGHFISHYEDTATADEQEKFLNYELTVYFCEGTDKEKLDWFRVINIAGEKLLDQELLNAVYTGPFVSDARRHFSKNGCPAYKLGANYLNGNAIEQAYLSTILKWAARHDGIAKIDEYMALHQFDPNANKLWAYFVAIITWIRSTFPKYRREMKGLDWGAMYDEFHENTYDIVALEKQIHDLMEDDEIMKKAGIYRYVLSGDLRDLSFRTFDKKQKREAYERQKGICVHCHKHFELEEMDADHITPWKEGGTTVADNCQMLCRNCNRIKGAK